MKLGVYSLVTPDYQAEDAAELIASIGYDAVEWTVHYDNAVWDGKSKWHVDLDNLEESARLVREASAANGLAIAGLGTRCNCFDLDGVRRNMEAAQLIGAPAIRVMAPGYNGSTHYSELFAKARAAYVEVEAIARDMGVRALLELHHGLITPSASAAMRVLEGRDPEWVAIMFDPGNMVNEGMENWRMGLEMIGPYLKHVHVKDAQWVRKEDGKWAVEWAGMADGVVDWPAVIDGLKSVGYEGFVDLEDLRGGWACKPVGITTEQKLREAYEDPSALL